jgi:hypothetical protein
MIRVILLLLCCIVAGRCLAADPCPVPEKKDVDVNKTPIPLSLLNGITSPYN